MNDEELDKSIKKSFENFIKELATNPEKVFDNNDLQIKYNNVLKEKIKLQSNWNSLREWLENLIDNFQEDVSTPILHEQMTIRLVYEYMEYLDKMN